LKVEGKSVKEKGAQVAGILSYSNVWGSFKRGGLELLHQEPPHTDGSWTWASNVVFLLSSRF